MYFKGIIQHDDLYIIQPIKHVELYLPHTKTFTIEKTDDQPV